MEGDKGTKSNTQEVLTTPAEPPKIRRRGKARTFSRQKTIQTRSMTDKALGKDRRMSFAHLAKKTRKRKAKPEAEEILSSEVTITDKKVSQADSQLAWVEDWPTQMTDEECSWTNWIRELDSLDILGYAPLSADESMLFKDELWQPWNNMDVPQSHDDIPKP